MSFINLDTKLAHMFCHVKYLPVPITNICAYSHGYE